MYKHFVKPGYQRISKNLTIFSDDDEKESKLNSRLVILDRGEKEKKEKKKDKKDKKDKKEKKETKDNKDKKDKKDKKGKKYSKN